jgi:DNA polymerase phi
MSGQEERDVLFARLFGITAIIQSGLLVRTQPLPSSASAAPDASSLAGFTDVLTHLLELGERKPWLRESVWWTVSLAVAQLHTSAVAWRGEAVEHTVLRIFVEDKAWSPEKVALAVTMRGYWPERDWAKFYAPTIKYGDVLHSSNAAALGKILKVGSEVVFGANRRSHMRAGGRGRG